MALNIGRIFGVVDEHEIAFIDYTVPRINKHKDDLYV